MDIPARCNLDVFVIEVLDEPGEVMALTEPSMDIKEGAALQLPPGAVSPCVDTGRRILGAPNRRPGGGLSSLGVIDENGCSPDGNLRTPPQVHSLVDQSRVNDKLEIAEGKKMTTLDPPIGLSMVEQEYSGIPP